MRSHQAHTQPPPAELWLHTRVFPAFPADRHPAVLSCGKDHGTPLYLPHFPAFSPCPPPLPAPRRLLALPVLASLPLPHPFPGKIPFPLFSRGRSPLAPACAGNKCKIHLFCTSARSGCRRPPPHILGCPSEKESGAFHRNSVDAAPPDAPSYWGAVP